MAGGLNGSGLNGSGNGKVASLDEARRRAAEKARQEKLASADVKRGGPLTLRDGLIGMAFVLMSLGMIWHWLSPLVGATGLTR
jgi:hypothetical protein